MRTVGAAEDNNEKYQSPSGQNSTKCGSTAPFLILMRDYASLSLFAINCARYRVSRSLPLRSALNIIM